MNELKEILIKVRTGGMDGKDKTGLEPWDELTVKEASKALQDLILREKIAENRRWLIIYRDTLAQMIDEADGIKTITQKCLKNNISLTNDRLAELQNQLKAKP